MFRSNIAVNSRGRPRSTNSQNRRIIKQMMYNNHTVQTQQTTDIIKNTNNGAVGNNNYQYSSTVTTYKTKEQIEAQELGLTAYSIKHGDVMLLGDIEYMLPMYRHDIDPNLHNVVFNNVFEGIKCDKIGYIYSQKKKQFMIIGLNDDYSSCILFKANNFKDLPNSENIDLQLLHPNIEIKENSNRLLISVYNKIPIYDLTSNPIMTYDISEIFKK